MILQRVNLILNFLSAGLGLVTVGLVLGRNKGRLSHRVSVRFTLAIAWLDVLKAVLMIVFSVWNAGGWSCKLVCLLLMWGFLAYMLLNGALAVNLYLVFVRGLVFSEVWAKYYFGGAFGLATWLSVILLVCDMFGWNAEFEVCEFREPGSVQSLVIVWLCFTGWFLLVCVYNFVVVLLALYKLWEKRDSVYFERQENVSMRSLIIRV